MAIVFLWSLTEVHGVGAEGAIPGDTEEAGAGEGAIGVDAVCELMAGLVLYTLALVDVGARLDGQLRIVLVLYHPLDDGNGRVARSLFHASLRRRDQVDAPFLPLGPSFYSASYLKLGLLRRLSQIGDWEAYLDGVHPIVEFAISLQEHVDDADALSGSISALSQTMTSLD